MSWMFVWLAACQPGGSPWSETTVGPSLECGDCEVLHDGEMAHFGDVVVVGNDEVDDAPAQWILCMDDLIACIEPGGAPLDCVDAAECPVECQKAIRKAARGVDGREAELDAIESVMIDDGALCELPGTVEVTL